jgi:hypothetical protein
MCHYVIKSFVDVEKKSAIIECNQLSDINEAPVAQQDRATDFVNLRFIDDNDIGIRLRRYYITVIWV